MRFSIIVCTYNRAPILELCGRSWEQLDALEHDTSELIVVDNNSSDSTQEVAASLVNRISARPGWSSVYRFEATQGLSAARNRGARDARGEWLVYIDDECIIPPNWLTRLDVHIRTKNPDMIGGPYKGKFLPGFEENAYPRAFQERFGDSHQRRDGWPDQWLTKPGLSGGNLAIRKETLIQLGGFNEGLGMSGAVIGYGEETELQVRLLREGTRRIYYARDLELVHLVRPEKASVRAALSMARRRAQAVAMLQSAEAQMNGEQGFIRRLRLGWVCTRRCVELAVRLAASSAFAVVSGVPIATVVHEEVHSGRVQAALQAAYAFGQRR